MKKYINIFCKAIVLLMVIFILIILAGSFMTTVNFSYLKSKKILIPIYFVASMILLGLIMILNNIINKSNNKRMKIIKIISVVLILIGQIFIISMFKPVQVTDSYVAEDEAVAIATNIQNKIDVSNTPYFQNYSNNNFYVVISILLGRLFKLCHIDYNLGYTIFNTIMIDLGILLTYLISKKVKDDKFALKTLIFNTLNPLTYLFIHWTYTITYAIPLMLLLIYIALLLKDEPRNKLNILYSFIFGMCLVISYFLRPTIVIPLTAILIYIIFYVIEKKIKIKNLAWMSLIILFTSIISYCIISNINKKYIDNGPTTYPLTHWIMIGLHGNGTVTSKDNAYTRSFKTKDEKKEANIKEIKRTIESYGVKGLIKHSAIKIPTTWSVGSSTYQQRLAQDTKHHEIYQYVVGAKKDILNIYTQSFRIVTIFLVLIATFMQIKNTKNQFLFFNTLIIFGAILFYLLWEAKSAYSVVFLPFLFIMSVYGIEKLKDELSCKNCKLKSNAIKIIFIITITISIFLSIKLSNNFTKKEVLNKHYSVSVTDPGIGYYINNLNSKKTTLKQEFKSKKEFNTIVIKALALNNDKNIKYKVNLKNEDEIITSQDITSEDIKKGNIIIDVEEGKTKINTNYILEITSNSKNNNTKDSIGFRNLNYKALDFYQGDLYINDNNNHSDLYIQVYQSKKTTYMNSCIYIIMCIFGIGLEVIIYLNLKEEHNKKSISKKVSHG